MKIKIEIKDEEWLDFNDFTKEFEKFLTEQSLMLYSIEELNDR
jgi:hypothetical protein